MRLPLPTAFLLLAAAAAAASAPDERARERERMILEIANLAEVTGVPEARRIDRRVLEAIRRVPRHLFVPEPLAAHAYANTALPIAHGQTISQPSIVALMTHLLELEPGHRVLEVGTGSGYQAAILAELAAEVRSIEIIEPLAAEAAQLLASLGYGNIVVRSGDGYAGWPDEAPFDRILVTAAAPHIPQPLLDQLKPGGRMVIPLSRGKNGDELVLITKDSKGRIRSRDILPVRFVPLTRSGNRIDLDER